MMHVKHARARREGIVDDPLSRQEVPEIVADKKKFVRPCIDFGAVVSDPKQLAHGIHGIGRGAGNSKEPPAFHLPAHILRLFLPAGIGIQHRVKQHLIRFSEQHKGLTERGDAHGGIPFRRQFFHHAEHARANASDIHIQPAFPFGKRVFFTPIGENFAVFRKELTLAARRAHVKAQKVHCHPSFFAYCTCFFSHNIVSFVL